MNSPEEDAPSARHVRELAQALGEQLPPDDVGIDTRRLWSRLCGVAGKTLFEAARHNLATVDGASTALAELERVVPTPRNCDAQPPRSASPAPGHDSDDRSGQPPHLLVVLESIGRSDGETVAAVKRDLAAFADAHVGELLFPATEPPAGPVLTVAMETPSNDDLERQAPVFVAARVENGKLVDVKLAARDIKGVLELLHRAQSGQFMAHVAQTKPVCSPLEHGAQLQLLPLQLPARKPKIGAYWPAGSRAFVCLARGDAVILNGRTHKFDLGTGKAKGTENQVGDSLALIVLHRDPKSCITVRYYGGDVHEGEDSSTATGAPPTLTAVAPSAAPTGGG